MYAKKKRIIITTTIINHHEADTPTNCHQVQKKKQKKVTQYHPTALPSV